MSDSGKLADNANRAHSSVFGAFDLSAAGSVALAAPKPSTPKECPLSEHSLDAVEAAIAKAASCEQSMDIFQACAFGASGYVALGQAVIGKCEGDFLGKLNA